MTSRLVRVALGYLATLPALGIAAVLGVTTAPCDSFAHSDGTSVAPTGSAEFSDTGTDTCADAALVPITIGPPGTPFVTTILGDNTPADGPDCDDLGDAPVWWESFELDRIADVTVDLCGTLPRQVPSYEFLYAQCSPGSLDCGSRIVPDVQDRQGGPCGDGNIWMVFRALPAGIYYYPVLSNENQLRDGRGPYQLQLRAQASVGACCDLVAGDCSDDILAEDCTGLDQVFAADTSCCIAECLPAGATFASRGVELLSHVDLPEFDGQPSLANDCWGYVSPSGREYAIIGLVSSVAFVEVTDPFNPVIVGQVFGPGSIWRDMRTFGTFAYAVVDSGGPGLQVIDLTEIDDGTITLRATIQPNGFRSAHNIAINEDSGYAYLVGANSNSGITALDLEDPVNPSHAGEWREGGVHDVLVTSYAEGPYAGREIAFAFTPGEGVYIVDVTDKSNMFTLSLLSYRGLSVTHQGWISEDRAHLFFGDEGDEIRSHVTSTTFVADISDLENPVLLGDFTSGLCSIDHNMIVRGNLLYEANYTSGLRVFDTSDIGDIKEVAFFDTRPEGNLPVFQGAWGVYPLLPSGIVIVSDLERGLFVLNYDCNVNGIDDTIDIGDGTSIDCNGNGLPDECERDCNGNGVPDNCDIASGDAVDANEDGIPDSCGCTVPTAPAGVMAGNRYLQFDTTISASSAIRVTIEDADGFADATGIIKWVGAPAVYPDEKSDEPGAVFIAAPLQCDPHFMDWSSVGSISVFGPEVIPNSTYALQVIDESCAASSLSDESAFSNPLHLVTRHWGDIVELFVEDGQSSQPDFTDIAAIVDKFTASPTAPPKALAQLQPGAPDPKQAISFSDVAAAVDAFSGGSYPFAGPVPCP